MAWRSIRLSFSASTGPSWAFFAVRGDVRLAQGGTSEDGNAQFGRLEIFDQGGWGTVCDNPDEFGTFAFNGVRDAGLTPQSAELACKQIGFEGGEKIPKAVRAM